MTTSPQCGFRPRRSPKASRCAWTNWFGLSKTQFSTLSIASKTSAHPKARHQPDRPTNCRLGGFQRQKQENHSAGQMSAATDQSGYGLSKQVKSARVPAPDLAYLPPQPRSYRPKIGLVGAGGVTEYHLRAYQKMGLEVTVICDVDRARAETRRKQFFPQAKVCQDFQEVLGQEEIEIIDAALHPEQRVPLLEAAIQRGKHVLSQKPLALDLDLAEQLADSAEE